MSKNVGCFDSCYELLSAQIDYAAGSTLMIKREVLNKVGLFDVSFKLPPRLGILDPFI